MITRAPPHPSLGEACNPAGQDRASHRAVASLTLLQLSLCRSQLLLKLLEMTCVACNSTRHTYAVYQSAQSMGAPAWLIEGQHEVLSLRAIQQYWDFGCTVQVTSSLQCKHTRHVQANHRYSLGVLSYTPLLHPVLSDAVPFSFKLATSCQLEGTRCYPIRHVAPVQSEDKFPAFEIASCAVRVSQLSCKISSADSRFLRNGWFRRCRMLQE